MGHDNLKGVDYIEKNGLERVTSIVLLMQMSVRTNFTVLQPHFPTCRALPARRVR